VADCIASRLVTAKTEQAFLTFGILNRRHVIGFDSCKPEVFAPLAGLTLSFRTIFLNNKNQHPISNIKENNSET
jgi:hypothetical protein